LVRGLQKTDTALPSADRASNRTSSRNVTDLSQVEIRYINKVELSYLVGNLQALANSIAQSPNFSVAKAVRLRAFVGLLVKQMLPLLEDEYYKSFFRMSEEGLQDGTTNGQVNLTQ